MGEHEMFKTTLMGGYDKEEVQELIQKMKDEMTEVQVNYRKQLAERDERIAELQKRIELKDAYQARMEEDIKEKYQKYIDNYESIGKLVFEAQLKSDSMQREAEEKCSKMIEEAEAEAKRRVESVQSEIDDKLLEGKKKYLAVQEEMNGIVELINQAQKRFMSSYKEVHQIINSMPTSLNDIEDVVDLEIQKLEGNSSDEILDTEEEIHLGDTQELDILDAVDDISDLEEFDEEDAEEDEDSKLAMQISKLLSEEDEAMIKELQKSAVLRNPNMAAATLVGAQAEAMKNAASNPNGAMMGFMGMNMASGGMNIQGLYDQGAAQKQAQQEQQVQKEQNQANGQNPQAGEPQNLKNKAAAPAAGGEIASWTCSCGQVNNGRFCIECGKPKPQDDESWTCSCGTLNKGKFCMECGKPKPQKLHYRCDKCGWEPEDPANPPKFCPECGDPFTDDDRS